MLTEALQNQPQFASVVVRSWAQGLAEHLDYTGGSCSSDRYVVEWVLLDRSVADRGQLALGTQKKRTAEGVHRYKNGQVDY